MEEHRQKYSSFSCPCSSQRCLEVSNVSKAGNQTWIAVSECPMQSYYMYILFQPWLWRCSSRFSTASATCCSDGPCLTAWGCPIANSSTRSDRTNGAGRSPSRGFVSCSATFTLGSGLWKPRTCMMVLNRHHILRVSSTTRSTDKRTGLEGPDTYPLLNYSIRQTVAVEFIIYLFPWPDILSNSKTCTCQWNMYWLIESGTTVTVMVVHDWMCSRHTGVK